ncbi:hypothetical protein BHE74_00056554 [Ensete ventricosum]|nr:hypothetical protein GW17_00062377 [Ensete ventricosum]RWW38224.1 hypothetical protein BHE74_00056554 [Ensete ventricosum]RZS24626.1 hypothetical protein BHM03_00057713 [Ensete ventricosum]
MRLSIWGNYWQVCSTWRAASRSELLWQHLTHRVWTSRRRSPPSWRDEFVRLHRTAANFRARRYAYSHLLPSSPVALSCRRLTLSDHHLAAGFLNGSVCLFDLPAGQLLATYWPDPHIDRLGRFSRAISGIVLAEPDERLAFASQDGDVHVVSLSVAGSVQRAHVGNLMEDGTLVDFTGKGRWWVGLFAGVPGRSWHVWDAATEQLVYVGGTLTDPDAVLGWHMLIDLSSPAVGRVRIVEPGFVIGCTASSMEIVDLNDAGAMLIRLELPHGAVVDSVDACEDRVIAVDSRGLAMVHRLPALQEICRFSTLRRAEEQHELGEMSVCMNRDYAVVSSADRVRVWDATTGEYLYSFRERIGEALVVAAGERYVAAWATDTGLHLWDFGDM